MLHNPFRYQPIYEPTYRAKVADVRTLSENYTKLEDQNAALKRERDRLETVLDVALSYLPGVRLSAMEYEADKIAYEAGRRVSLDIFTGPAPFMSYEDWFRIKYPDREFVPVD